MSEDSSAGNAPVLLHPDEGSGPCDVCQCMSGKSLIESKSSGIPIKRKQDLRKLSHNNAKLILKRPSMFTTETLYDHLVEIIKRIIDERPANVVDYFEEFSRDVRKHKYRLCDLAYVTQADEPEFLAVAKAVLKSLRLYFAREDDIGNGEEMYEDNYDSSSTTVPQSSASSVTRVQRNLLKNENVIQLQHYWAFCGLGFQIDEVFQLSWAIQKVQNHHCIRSARFWGKIYGTHASYYIVEAEITKSERLLRLDHVESKLVKKMIAFIKKKLRDAEPPPIDTELVPGYDWQEYPGDELQKMQPPTKPVPTLNIEETFEMPPEPIGTGLNRKTYFVTRALSEEWKELPIVTPKQIVMSRKIRKYFTGYLDAKLSSYPTFPGTEKNYLRAMIARITAGSYIAPNGYYRKMTKKERDIMDREGELFVYDEGEEEETDDDDFEDEFAEDIIDNDCPIVEDEKYEPFAVDDLKLVCVWVHYRPHILMQGTITYIDESVVIKNLAKVALKRMKEMEMGNYEEGEGEASLEVDAEAVSREGEQEEEDFGEEEDFAPEPETGPELFAFAEDDMNCEDVEPWSSRASEYCNSVNQTIIMRSNLWPGAYSFINGKWCDSIYLGWGTKYIARCGVMEHLPDIQNFDFPDDVFEATDPTVEMEERWHLYHLRKEIYAPGEEMSISVEYDNDDEDVVN